MSYERLRDLPSVDEVLRELDPGWPHDLKVAEIRRELERLRERLIAGEDLEVGDVVARVRANLDRLSRGSLRRVINATGVVLHTNLGRAPLGDCGFIAGYSNLEYDLEAGRRGKRDVHAGGALEALLGVPGIVVNNNAAAVYLVLNSLAEGAEVIVSRGELIEIGDGFRIPEIMARSGATLREVGTTNRTNIDDYRAAINERTRLILRVHPSNFHVQGFTAKPALSELVALGRERQVTLYEDLGSGCLVDLRAYGIDEPLVRDSLAAGVTLVSFSGDKLLGGPQAGIIAGAPALVAFLRKNPMFRALRVDKLTYQALDRTLRCILWRHYECIPALSMIMESAGRIRTRAEGLRLRVPCDLVEGRSVIGGGSTPDQSLPTWLLALPGDAVALERRLRLGNPPVLARIEDGRVLLDLRTVLAEEEDELVAALSRALAPTAED